MRQLTVEFPKSEFSKVEGNSRVLQGIKNLQLLTFLRHNDEEMTMICRVELEPQLTNVEDYIKHVSDDTYQMQLVEQEKAGTYVVLVKHKLNQPSNQRKVESAFWEKLAYVVSIEVWSNKFRITSLGSLKQIKSALKTLETNGIRHKILSNTDAKFAPDSPLGALTDKQRRILIAAYKLGYYDLPRKINSRQLSEKLGLHKSALATHIRKAELRLLATVLNKF
jgi:predicted DNA binding protein